MDFWRPGDSIKSHGFGEENLYIYQMVCVSVELDNPGGGGHGRFLIPPFFSIPPSMTMTKCHTSSIPPPFRHHTYSCDLHCRGLRRR